MIYSSIDRVNKDLSMKNKIKKYENSVIFENSKIDSMAFVNFIMSIEENIYNDFNISIDLANEELLMEKLSPFRTVKTLTDYIQILIKNHNNKDLGNVKK